MQAPFREGSEGWAGFGVPCVFLLESRTRDMSLSLFNHL